MIKQVQLRALSGEKAHLSAKRALEGLTFETAGRKTDLMPYTIWQLLKHMNYWQQKWLDRLDGKPVAQDSSWKNGWTEEVNASSPEVLNKEVTSFLQSIEKVKNILEQGKVLEVTTNEYYSNQYEIIQAMASHLSYHLGELVLLRRILGNWPPQSGGYVW